MQIVSLFVQLVQTVLTIFQIKNDEFFTTNYRECLG